MIFKIIIALLVFMAVVVFHEYGHFFFAKRAKIKVNEFSVGMGPKIVSTQKGETQYSIRCLPLGGYCAMEGEDEGEIEGAFEETGNFNQAPIIPRILTVLAGPVFNFILAFIILLGLFLFTGVQTTEISTVADNSVAYKSGILAGDKIVEVNGKKISKFSDVRTALTTLKENKTNVKVIRNSVEKNIEIEFEGNNRILGIQSKLTRNVLLAFVESVNTFNYFIKSMFNMFGQLFTGKVGVGQLSGPIGVVGAISNAASNGVYSLLYMMAFLSVNLGFINLLPIPALDGGRLVFLYIELIFGRPVSREKEGYVHIAGFIFLISLIIFVTFKDIVRLNLF